MQRCGRLCISLATALLLIAGGSAVLAASPGQTYISFMRAINEAKDLPQIYRFLPRFSVQEYEKLKKPDQMTRLKWYKHHYVHDIKIEAESDDGDTAEIAGSAICDRPDNKWKVQVFVTFLKEDGDWKIKEFRHDALKSPYGYQIRH